MASDERHIRLTEEDAVEGGVRCPNCGGYNAFGDIVATGQCRNAWESNSRECVTGLELDLVVRDL